MFTFIEISRRQRHSTSSAFIRLLRRQYRASKGIQKEFSQSFVRTLCVWRVRLWFKDLCYKDLWYKDLLNICYCVRERVKRIITIKANCCCLSQIVKSGARNYANNKELIWNQTQIYFYFICNLGTNIFNVFKRVKNVIILFSIFGRMAISQMNLMRANNDCMNPNNWWAITLHE